MDGRELELSLGTLLGLNNRLPEFRLRTEAGTFVRAAANVDISDGFNAKRRQGFARAVAGTDCHSFWVDEVTNLALFADGASLYKLVPTATGVAGNLLSATAAGYRRALSYVRVNDEILFTNGSANYALRDGETVVRPLGMAPLSAAPAVAASAGGALEAGYYTVAFAFVNGEGELSALTEAAQVSVAAAGALAITGLPASWPTDATGLLVYVSPPNGEVLFLQARLSAPAASRTITTLGVGGAQAATQFMVPMPAGQIMRYFGGRLHVAAGSTLWYSNIYSPALCTPTKGYVQFPAPITVFEPCEDGCYLVADATYWLAGDIASATAQKVSAARGVLGTGGRSTVAQQCFWMSDKGLVAGSPGGAIKLLQDQNVVVDSAQVGATLFREADGQRQLVSSLFGGDGSTAAASSYMDAEVVRKGTTL